MLAALALAGSVGCTKTEADPAGALDQIDDLQEIDGLDDLGSTLEDSYDGVRDQIGATTDTLASASECLADAARETWGDAALSDYGVMDGEVESEQLLGALDGDVDELDQVIGSCVNVEDTLVSAFEGIGLSESSAACVTDVVINDRQLRNGLLVQLVFGDPGVGTALVAAARVGRACLDPAGAGSARDLTSDVQLAGVGLGGARPGTLDAAPGE